MPIFALCVVEEDVHLKGNYELYLKCEVFTLERIYYVFYNHTVENK